MGWRVMVSRDNARGLLGVFLALAIIAIIDFAKPSIASAPDFSCGEGAQKEVRVDVSQGESGSSIAEELYQLGVTKSSAAFFRIAVANPKAGSIAPGIHRIQTRLCATDALTQLLDRSRIENLISIPEGAWNSEIFESLRKLGHTEDEILSAARVIDKPAGFTSLEGLLFPAQYSFDSATSLTAIFLTLISRSIDEMERAGFSDTKENFSQQELLTIASLVQAEGDTKDFSKISQVVRNRLAQGMPLQFDSTVHYIKKVRGSIFLSTKSTLISSPYNTYRRTGLPPTPINNPGARALYAATHPEKGSWIYFITVAPGDTRFTDSYAEFMQWKVLYKKNLRDGKFGG
jgi:UPF0755 protein